jgi:hypothetical protein
MSGPIIPQPKLPHLPLPHIRGIPNIPHVGCSGASGTSYLGEQFGNLPDLHAALAMKNLKKAIEEQIYALIQGELPDAVRPPVYAARAAQLINEVAELVQTLNQVIAGVIAEANASINFINGKINDINAAKNTVLAIPAGARSAVQRLALQRYNEYLGELNAQVGRLQTTIGCISS